MVFESRISDALKLIQCIISDLLLCAWTCQQQDFQYSGGNWGHTVITYSTWVANARNVDRSELPQQYIA
jgi:hypothetical protein